MTNNPLVSVIIPTYNRANTIIRAIDSVGKQTYKNIEIIVIDDASIDDTNILVSQCNNVVTKYIRLPNNIGGSAARNVGIKASAGELISFLDSDDEWIESKLEKQVNVFNNSDDSLGVIYTGFEYVDENHATLYYQKPTKSGYIYDDLLISNVVGTTSTVIVKRKYLIGINGFDEKLPSCQDWDLYIRLSELCKFSFINELLVRYHTSSNSIRIYCNPEKVVSGHKMVTEKYKKYIEQLPIPLKAQRLSYLAKMYFSAGAVKEATIEARKAFVLTKNIKYLIQLIVGLLRVLRKKSRMFTKFKKANICVKA